MKLSNFSTVEKLKRENNELLKENDNFKSVDLNDVKALKDKRQSLKIENDNLRKEYWKYRNIYDEILNSDAWKRTESLRKFKKSFKN